MSLVKVSIVEGFGNRVFYLIGHFYTHFHLTLWGDNNTTFLNTCKLRATYKSVLNIQMFIIINSNV